MPFLSESQRRLCWARYSRDIRDGNKPKWDCDKFEKETKKPLPYYHRQGCNCEKGSFKKSRNRFNLTPIKLMSRKKRRSLHRSLSRSRKIRTGPRGGKYVLVKGKKIYV